MATQKIYSMSKREVHNLAAGFQEYLKPGRLLDSAKTPTVSPSPATGVTLTNIAVNTNTIAIEEDDDTAAKQAVQFTVDPSETGTYKLTVASDDDASPPDTLERIVYLLVTD